MSMSAEYYQAQLAALRRVYAATKSLKSIASDAPSCGIEDKMFNLGSVYALNQVNYMIMLHIKDVQRSLRRICGVEKKYDRIYMGGAR